MAIANTNARYPDTSYVGQFIQTTALQNNTVQIEPSKVFEKTWLKMMKHTTGNYQMLYSQMRYYTRGDAAALTVQFNRMNPLVAPYREHRIVNEGDIPQPVRVTFKQFTITAKQYGIHMIFGDRYKLFDFYGVVEKGSEQLLEWTNRALTEISRDTLVLGGTRKFASKLDGSDGVADKDTVGYLDIGQVVSDLNKLKTNKAYPKPYQLMVSEATAEYLKWDENSQIAKALQDYQTTQGLSARVRGLGFVGNIGDLEIYTTPSPAHTYGDAGGVQGDNQLGGTNAPVDLTEISSGSAATYQLGSGATNKRLAISILRVGESAHRLGVIDPVANIGENTLIYKDFNAGDGSTNPLNQIASLGSKFYYGSKVTDSAGIINYFHLEADAQKYLKVKKATN